MKCEICSQGPPDGPAIYRVNKPGEMPARWRCERHLTELLRRGLDKEVVEITQAIEAGKEYQCPPEAGATQIKFEGQYAPMEMIKRAVTNARAHRIGFAPRWVAVRDALGYGSTTSSQLCEYFGLDPNEQVCLGIRSRTELSGS